MIFNDLLTIAKEESKTNLCLELNVIDKGKADKITPEEKLNAIIRTIDEFYENVCSFNIDCNYILDLSAKQQMAIASAAHSRNRPIIINMKLSGEKEADEIAIKHFANLQFDAITFTPLVPDYQSLCEKINYYGMEPIMVDMMHLDWVRTEITREGIPFFQLFIRRSSHASGILIEITDAIGEKEIKALATEIAPDKLIFVSIKNDRPIDPIEHIIKIIIQYFKENIIWNVEYNKTETGNSHLNLKRLNLSIKSIKKSIA